MTQQKQTTQELFALITENNTIQEIKETVKLFMDSLKETTLNRLLTEDSEYQTCQREYQQAYESYQSDDFSNIQRDTVDRLLAHKEDCVFEHITNAYMAGLIDSYRISKILGLARE